MWDVLGLGIDPVFPALAGELFTSEPSGRPLEGSFNLESRDITKGECKGREGKEEDSEGSTYDDLQQFRCTCLLNRTGAPAYLLPFSRHA